MKKCCRLFGILSAAVVVASGCAKEGAWFGGMGFYEAMSYGGIEEVFDNENGGQFKDIVENKFINVADEPVSTFSLDADGASYSFIKKCIKGGMSYSGDAIRIEEFINYFPFNYADPKDGESVALNAEIGDCPWAKGHKVIRLGIKGKSLKDSEKPTANFVFLVDVSGSMDSDDKLPLLKKGLINLVDHMNPEDRISIITYSGSVKKLLESTPAKNAKTIKKAINKLSAAGSTNGGEAMKMAYEEAKRNFIVGGNNRVIMGTDGDFNVGVTDTDTLLEMLQNYAKEGIYLTVCGFGYGNLNDSMMETFADKGNGTYEMIADETDMTKVFVNECSKFVTVANDCKVQITFNPEAVQSYRLIGYENRLLQNEDFENDEKDAAEVGAGQTITALYEIIPAEGFATGARCADFDFRYKKDLNSSSKLLSEKLAYDGKVSEDFNFACSIAAFGMILRSSEYKGDANLKMVKDLATKGSKSFDPYDYRKEFLSLIDKAAERQ